MNLCTTCGLDFTSVAAFDAHRTGDHGLDWPEHEKGRRCRDEDELQEAGLEPDDRGRWRLRVSDVERERLEALRRRAA